MNSIKVAMASSHGFYNGNKMKHSDNFRVLFLSINITLN